MFLTRGGRLVVASLAVMPAFGSESYLAPWPAPEVWHHEGLTRDAAEAAGFSRAAGGEIAFHATYIDHYLVNPLWRLRGGLARVRAARAIRDDLATLHFDDLPTPEAVTAAWQRYLGGTVAALLWAENAWRQGRPGAGAGADAVASARQVIGLGLHAVQDFASHSTWINHPDRRTATWREWSAAGGEIADLTTGAVESQGSVRHGDLGLRRAGWHPAAVPLRWGIATPAWLTAHSPGINLDTRWQAPLGVLGRGDALVGHLTGDEAFTAALNLAARSSREWLELLATIMRDAGASDFWQAVTGTPERETDPRRAEGLRRARRDLLASGARAFEEAQARGQVFLAAGWRGDDDGGWYLRVDASLGRGLAGGPGPEPGPGPGLGLGRGPRRAAVRVLGPFAQVPDEIGAPTGGRIDAVTAFRHSATHVEVRGYRVGIAVVGTFTLTETWRRRALLPPPGGFDARTDEPTPR